MYISLVYLYLVYLFGIQLQPNVLPKHKINMFDLTHYLGTLAIMPQGNYNKHL